jgi:hypothetical protein
MQKVAWWDLNTNGPPISKERACNPMCLAHVDWNKKGGQPIASSSSSEGFYNPQQPRLLQFQLVQWHLQM